MELVELVPDEWKEKTEGGEKIQLLEMKQNSLIS